MSVFQYNGITLPYSYFTDFRQEAQYDEVGNTDYWATKFVIETQFFVNVNYLSLLAPELTVNPGAFDNAADIMNVIRSRLLQPRRKLSIKFAGVDLIPQPQEDLEGTVDVANGPKPLYCNPVSLTDTTFLVNYGIEAHYWEKNLVNTSSPSVTNRVGSNVLFNRWRESVTFDPSGYSTRTREGKVRIRSDNADGKIADEVRSQMAVTGVPQGFTRENSVYSVDPSGLLLAYRITDVEEFKMPPPPAFEADGWYDESTGRGGNPRYGMVFVRLRGSKTTPQADLVRAAVGVAYEKVRSANSIFSGLPFWRAFTGEGVLLGSRLRIGLYDNWVECHMRVMLAQKKERFWGNAFLRPGVVGTPGSDGVDYTPNYQDRGSAGLLLLAAAYYDPSLRTATLKRSNNQLNSSFNEPGQAGKYPEV